ESKVEPTVALNKYMAKRSSMYVDYGPQMVYRNVATLEARFHASDNIFWRILYSQMEPISCAYTTAGLIECNSLVSMELFTSNDNNCTPEQRRCLPYHRGFVDSYYTPQSKSADRIRTLVSGVRVRIMTQRTLEIAADLVSS
ncbi:hypothetical protein QBC39DRAFT_242650, partial [Podospora conica]